MGVLAPNLNDTVTIVDMQEGWVLALPTDNDKAFIVDKPYTLTAIYQGKVHNITVPSGFLTDLASIPRFATGFVKQFGRHTPAAIFHDWCYEQSNGYHTKAFADNLFFALLQLGGVPTFKQHAMYLAVKIGGRGNYGGQCNGFK